MLVGTASMVLLIPSAGLAIDAALLYYTKARIQGSVDGAALAAARSLSLGATTAAQSATAKQNAVNWFYANFPTTLWGTSNTQMDQSSVTVFDDPNNANLRNVTVTAKTTVPTIFMRWFNKPSTDVGSIGNASRRDAVVMMVLDRSGSMGATCNDLKAAAKVFTGQFAAQRDRIGMVTFSDGTFVASAPSTAFRTTLGYDDGTTVGAGAIDNIGCQGGTNTAAALSVGYNELYKMDLPGAFNVLFLETDGLPNTMTLNWWDTAASTVGLVAATSNCTDKNGNKLSVGGWNVITNQRDWNNTNGYAMGPNGFMADIPPGAVGSLYSSDPVVASPGTGTFQALFRPWHTSSNQGATSEPALNGCAFSSGTRISDLAWIPATDVYGNAINPATNPYKGGVSPLDAKGRLDFTVGTANQKWQRYHNAALNATDNAAYRARTNGTIPATMFVIGLGGNNGGGPPIDHTLLQRIANDPAADGFNSPAAYNACATTPNCVNYLDQPQGTYIFSVDHTELKSAFLKLSSQILRLSK